MISYHAVYDDIWQRPLKNVSHPFPLGWNGPSGSETRQAPRQARRPPPAENLRANGGLPTDRWKIGCWEKQNRNSGQLSRAATKCSPCGNRAVSLLRRSVPLATRAVKCSPKVPIQPLIKGHVDNLMHLLGLAKLTVYQGVQRLWPRQRLALTQPRPHLHALVRHRVTSANTNHRHHSPRRPCGAHANHLTHTAASIVCRCESPRTDRYVPAIRVF